MNFDNLVKPFIQSMARELTRHNDDAREAAKRRLAGPITIPGVTWHSVIDLQTRKWQGDALRYVKRTRHRFLQVNHEGVSWKVARADLRDYLKEVDLPVWLRAHRPHNGPATIRIRRPEPFMRAGLR